MTGVRTVLLRAAAGLRGLLFPRVCAGCDAVLTGQPAEVPLCRSCLEQYKAVRITPCPQCRNPIAMCRCTRLGNGGTPLYSLLPYHPGSGKTDPAAHMLLSRKDRLVPETEAFLAGQMAPLCECVIAEDPGGTPRSEWLLTYPPRSPAKRREVGHDQSEALVRRLSVLTGLAAAPCLVRVRGKNTAQKTLDAAERTENANDSYRFDETYADTVRGKHVMIIDDIATTGATLAACASLLEEAGAAGTAALTAAKTVRNTDNLR